MIRFLLVPLFLLVATVGFSQITSTAQRLRLARSTYEQGRLHELPDLLKDILKSGDKSQKVEAYELLAEAYIYLEEPEKADESMLNLLRTDPYYRPNPDVAPAELVALYKTFRTRPIYRLGVKLALNASQPNVTQFNPITDGTSKYGYKLGYGGGIVGEIPLNLPWVKDRMTLNPEIFFTTKSFNNESSSATAGTTFSTTTGAETQSWVSVPVLLQYQLVRVDEFKPKRSFIERLNPYISFGVSVDYLLSAKTDVDQKRVDNQSIDVRSIVLDTQREKININAVLAAGIKTRIAGGYLVADVRYFYGLSKVNSSSTLFSNQILLNDYKLMDGIFSLNAASINVGYVQNFFNPKKLKRK